MISVSAESVPPAERIGPAKYTAAYLVPSEFCLILTLDIPCMGEMVTPSVITAKPTRTALSSAFSWLS